MHLNALVLRRADPQARPEPARQRHGTAIPHPVTDSSRGLTGRRSRLPDTDLASWAARRTIPAATPGSRPSGPRPDGIPDFGVPVADTVKESA
ncbi:hypothetical protein QF030_006352 [Streptomyces rishiriensis]|uniref:Uncharacterized protein n=1 Tax=Streptomyces rishiriensis TaxID=68264 RepID=A0ABU0NYN3_STRRH|nr:hypothetical protein [Streptomyces rishiriensis]